MDQEYTISTGTKIFYSAIAVLLVAFAVFVFMMPKSPQVSAAVYLLPLTILLGAILIIVNLLKRKVTISADQITNTNVFYSRTLYLSQIRGCRVGQKMIVIEPVSANDKRIVIGNYIDLGNSDQLKQYFKDHFTDLDAADLSHNQAELLQDSSLGATAEDRQATLKQAKLIANIYNVVGGVGSAILFFCPHNLYAFYAMALLPLIGILIMVTGKGLIKLLSDPKRSPYPFVMIGFMLSAMFLFMTAMTDYELLSLHNFWLPFGVVAVLMISLLYSVGMNRTLTSPKGQVIFMIVLACLYSAGLTIKVNCLFDHSPRQVFRSSVMSKYYTSGKGAHYHVRLTPWLEGQGSPSVDVSSGRYDRVTTGTPVKIYQQQGKLNIPWYDYEF